MFSGQYAPNSRMDVQYYVYYWLHETEQYMSVTETVWHTLHMGTIEFQNTQCITVNLFI